MEVAKVTIKLLRADGQGHMLRIWNTYSADVSGYRCMNPSQFAALLSDLAGSTSSSVNATPMFEQFANIERSLRSEPESAAVKHLSESTIGFRVFPSLLADVSSLLFPTDDAVSSRQRFMKQYCLPLSEAIAAGTAKRMSPEVLEPPMDATELSAPVEAAPASRPVGSSPRADKYSGISPRYMQPKAEPEYDGGQASPGRTITNAQLEQFLHRQAKAEETRQARKSAILDRMVEEEAGAAAAMQAKGAQISEGSKRILGKMERDGVTANTRHVPDALLTSGNGTPGRALYQNAMRKLERQAAAQDEQAKEEHSLRNQKRASEKSEAMVRRRLARELAAACVYIAAQRTSQATSQTATTDSAHPAGTQSGKVELLPWWLLCLAPSEVATVLSHTGFLLGPVLEASKASLLLSHAQEVEAFTRHVHETDRLKGRASMTSPLNVSSAFAQGIMKYLPPGVSVQEAEQLRQLGQVWSAAVGSEGDAHHTLPAVRLLALLQSLVTGAYDVRSSVLMVAAKEIGMSRPLVLIVPFHRAQGHSSRAISPGPSQTSILGLDLGLVPSPKGGRAGLMSTVHPDVPSIFQAALVEHLKKLREIAEGSGSSSTINVDAITGDPHVDSFPAPVLAREVLDGQVSFPAAALAQLKPLYSNRLAFLSALTRRDNARVVAAAASREVIEQDAKNRAPGTREELGDGFVRALHGNESDGPDVDDVGGVVGIARKGRPRTSAVPDECTFAPALCKKSIELADRQMAAMMPLASDSESSQGAPGDDEAAQLAAAAARLRREQLMYRYKAQVEARNEEMRKVKQQQEMEECTFRPDTSATASYRASQASEYSSTLGRVYVPSYKSLVQTALNSVPGAASDPAVQAEAAEEPWLTRAAPLAAIASTTGGPGSRSDWLYHLAAIRIAAIDHAKEVRDMALQAVEMQGCTFKPETNWGKAKALKASRRPAATKGDEYPPSPTFPDEEDEVVQVEIPLTVGTDAAMVLAQPGGPAIQPHLSGTSKGVSMGDGKAVVTVSRRLASAKGLDGHLSRVVRGRAEKEEKKRLDAALSAGVLHKRAVVRDAQGRTVVKPFAFVASFRQLAHEGYVVDGDEGKKAGQEHGARAVVDVDHEHHWEAGIESRLQENAFMSPVPARPHNAVQTEQAGASDGANAQDPPLMFVDVTVAAGQIERLPVWHDTDLAVLAVEFADKHGLAKRTARRLEKMMQAQREQVLMASKAL